MVTSPDELQREVAAAVSMLREHFPGYPKMTQCARAMVFVHWLIGLLKQSAPRSEGTGGGIGDLTPQQLAKVERLFMLRMVHLARIRASKVDWKGHLTAALEAVSPSQPGLVPFPFEEDAHGTG